MSIEHFPIEAGHIMMFARAIGDLNPIFYGALDGESEVQAPPTFVQAGAHYDPEYPLRPQVGRKWLGSGREATGRHESASEGGRGTSLLAEQHFEYRRPLRGGDVVRVAVRPGATWEKMGRKAGRLLFSERISEYRDQAGELVIVGRTVGVRTERFVDPEQ